VNVVETAVREDLIDDAPSTVQEPVPKRKRRRARRTRRGPLRSSSNVSAILWTLAALSGLAVWALLHAFVLTSLEERGSQKRLYAQFREQLGNATAPQGGSIKPGSPVALVDAGIDGLRRLVVIEGTTAGQLTRGPGHLSDTPLPGQPGVSVIFGRSVTYGAPFRSLSRMQAGETITVTTGQGVFEYRVDRVRRPGDLLPPPLPANGSGLMLVTSAADGWRSGWAPDHMIYLDATLTGGEVKPAPTHRPTAVSKSALAMQGETGVLVLVVFWLQGVLLVSVGLAWARIRWGRWQTLVTGLPLALAVLWGASGAAVRLLPNLI
jgi:sortase A